MSEPESTPEARPGAMPSAQLKSQKFREAREAEWRQLSRSLERYDRGGLSGFSVEDILNLPLLYRSAVSSLSTARSISLDRNLINWLEALCTRAYVTIYGPHSRLKDVLGAFFLKAWPARLRSLWPELVLSLLVLVLGIAAGYVLCVIDPIWYDTLLPGEERNPASSVGRLKDTLGRGEDDNFLAVFAVFLMSHNTQVAIAAFAFGIVFGLPTIAALFINGATLGAMMWLFVSKGLGVEFAGWLSIHGTTELFAIVIAGACGFHIARHLMFPGDRPRLAALRQAGLVSGIVMIGVAIMLTVAGLLEGFGRQLITDTWLRFSIGAAMLALWGAYFWRIGRERSA